MRGFMQDLYEYIHDRKLWPSPPVAAARNTAISDTDSACRDYGLTRLCSMRRLRVLTTVHVGPKKNVKTYSTVYCIEPHRVGADTTAVVRRLCRAVACTAGN